MYMCGACAHMPMETRILGGLCHSLPPCSFDTVPLWAWTWSGSQLTPSGDSLPSHSCSSGVRGMSFKWELGCKLRFLLLQQMLLPATSSFQLFRLVAEKRTTIVHPFGWKWFASRDAVYVWLWSTGCRNPSSTATLCGGTLMSWERQPRRPRFAHRMAISIGSTWSSVLGLILCWVRQR